MLNIKGGDELNVDIYYVKEHKEVEVVGKDGIVNKIHTVEGKIVVNPPDSYLNKPNVEVVSRRRIIVQIMEINKVGGMIVQPHYLVGMRFIDNNKPTPVFHIMVKSDEEFREKVKKELEYYLKTAKLIKA